MTLIRHFVVTGLLLLAFGSVAEARLARVSQPAEQSPSDQKPRAAAPAPLAPAPAPAVTCAPPVCNPCQKMNIILQVKDPCTCCLVEVPVCIPTCCTGNPTVCCRCGCFGRQIVAYSWSCGVTVEVVFKRNGCYFVRYCGCC